MGFDGEELNDPNEWLSMCPTQEAYDELFDIFVKYLHRPGSTMTDADDERMRDLTGQAEGCFSYIYDLELEGYAALPRFAQAAAAVGRWEQHSEALWVVWNANPYGHKIQGIRDFVGNLIAQLTPPKRSSAPKVRR